jgi:predicted transcriptional regulator
LNDDKLAEQLHVDRSTISRNCKEALEDLSVVLFGIDMINDW